MSYRFRPARAAAKSAIGSLDAAILNHAHYGRNIFKRSTVSVTFALSQIKRLYVFLRQLTFVRLLRWIDRTNALNASPNCL